MTNKSSTKLPPYVLPVDDTKSLNSLSNKNITTIIEEDDQHDQNIKFIETNLNESKEKDSKKLD